MSLGSANSGAGQSVPASSIVKTCVFPIAGLASSFQPASKTVPRALLPILDRPLILYAVEEALRSGCERLVFVERPGASPIRRFFERDAALERDLSEALGAEAAAALARATSLPAGCAQFVEQTGGRGLGHAVACAREAVGDEPFAVILPDDLVLAERPVLAQMIDRRPRSEGAVIAGIEVTRIEIARYGIMRIEDDGGDVVRVTGLIEKPELTDMESAAAGSNFAISGRYLLPPEIFTMLETTAPDAEGAVQLTDAIAALIGRLPVWGVRFEGERFDCGGLSGVTRATIAEALRRPELRGDALVYMRRMLERIAAQHVRR